MIDKYFDLILNFIVSPKVAIEELKQRNYLTFAVFVFLAAVFSQTLTSHLIFVFKGQQSVVMFCLGYFSTLFVLLLFGLIYVSWIHFVASYFVSFADIKTVISAFALCFVPIFISSPLSVILITWTGSPLLWYILVMFFVSVWMFCLVFMTIRNIYSLTPIQSIIVFLSPLIPVAIFFVITILMITAGIYSIRML